MTALAGRLTIILSQDLPRRSVYAGAPGMTKEVTFEPVDGPINYRIDHAYRAKYRQPVPQPHDRRARSLRDPKQTSAST